MKRHLPGLRFSASLGLLCAGYLMVHTHGGRGEETNATPVAAKSASVGVKPLRSPTPPSDADRARAAILEAARCHGIESRAWQLQNVAWRESRLNPYAFNDKSGAMGLFQFKPATWSFAVHKMGRLHLNPWRMEDNAEAAAWMWAHGYANHWGMEP